MMDFIMLIVCGAAISFVYHRLGWDAGYDAGYREAKRGTDERR